MARSLASLLKAGASTGAEQYIADTGSGQSLSFSPQMPVSPSVNVNLQNVQVATLGADPGGYHAAQQQTFSEMGKLGQALFTAIQAQKEQDEDIKAISQLATIQKQNMTFQAEYATKHQGESALTAGKDYANFSDRLFDDLAKSKQWQGNARAQNLFAQKKAEYGAAAFGAGTNYAEKQRAVWREDVQKGNEEAFFQAVAGGNEAMIQQTKQNAVAAWRITYPGRNSTVYENDLARRGAIGSLDMAYAMGDGQNMKNLVGRFSGILGPEQTAKYSLQSEELLGRNIQGRVAVGDYAGARVLAQQAFGVGSQIEGSKSTTGVAVLAKKYEAGNQGVGHVSQGLKATDGNDFGSYSFITKEGAKSSGAEFIQWAGTQGGVGKQLCDQFAAVLGGDWNRINDASLWKQGGALRKAWQDIAKENPQALETLEDQFVMRRVNSVISQLRPEVQQAIRQNPALMEMAISTINQHRTAVKILNSNFNADPATYIHNVYGDRADPARFAATGDPNIGKRRMPQEEKDCLRILQNTGGVQNQGVRDAITVTMNKEIPGREILQQIQALPTIEDREVEADRLLAQLPDFQRQDAATIVTQELNFQKNQRTAQEAKDAADFYTAAQENSWTPLQIGQQIDSMAASGKYRHDFIVKLRTLEKERNKQETEQQKVNALNLMAALDRQMTMTGDMVNYDATAIDNAFANGAITFKQRNDIIDYARNGGLRKNVTVENVQEIYRKLVGDKKAIMDPELFSQVYEQLKGQITTGKPLENEAISRVVADKLSEVEVKDKYIFLNGHEPAWKAAQNERTVVGMTVPAYRLPAIRNMMKVQGYSDEQISDDATVAKFYANIMQNKSN